MHENLADTITPNFNINPDVLKPGYKVPAYKTQQHNPSNMAQFGMSQEHKDVLRRKNRVFLLEELDPEPIIQRLFQINMNSKTALKDIQALPTNYRKGVALLQQLPKHGPCAFAYFCRALSASGQNHMRNKIQESVMWCIGFITLLNYDGETLHLQKGICRRSISITHSEWNNLILYIPKILENLDPCKDSKFCLSDENLYVTITSDFNDLEIKDLIHLCYIYILERDIIARAHYNCYGCQQEALGQRDHMENGCLADWEDFSSVLT